MWGTGILQGYVQEARRRRQEAYDRHRRFQEGSVDPIAHPKTPHTQPLSTSPPLSHTLSTPHPLYPPPFPPFHLLLTRSLSRGRILRTPPLLF